MKDVKPFQLWHECLLLSDRSRWTDQVELWFGPQHGLPWPQWWERSQHLFADDTPPFFLQEIESPEDFADYWESWRSEELNDTLVVWFNLANKKEDLLAAFERLLRKRHTGKRGRPRKDGRSIAEFELERKVHVQSVETALNAYRAWVANASLPKSERKKQWEIAVRYGVNPSQIPDDPEVRPGDDERRILTIAVNRCIRRAKTLIDGVQRGVFPAI